MTSPNTMNRTELIELAALDAFDLLDEVEASQYNRAFLNAPVGVQNEILELQAELAGDLSLLPKEDPDASLRQRVLDAVARTIEADAARFAPIGSIGRHAAKMDDGKRQKLIAANYFWRAAAFALAAMTVIMAFFLSDAYQSVHVMATHWRSQEVDDQLKEVVGPGLQEFLGDPRQTVIASLQSVDPEIPCSAQVYVDKKSGQALILAQALPATTEPYTIERVDSGGKEVTIQTLEKNGLWHVARIADFFNPDDPSLPEEFQIRTPAGRVLLTGSVIKV